MNPIYKLRHKIQMLKDFLQLLSTGPVTLITRNLLWMVIVLCHIQKEASTIV